MSYEEKIEKLFARTPSFQQVGTSAYKPGLDAMMAFDSLTGDQEVDIPDAALAEAGSITFWAELSGDPGDIIVKTSLLPYVVGAGETYVAPEAAEGGSGGGGEE